MVRKDAWNDFDFFEFIKFRFMAQDVIYPGEGSMSRKLCFNFPLSSGGIFYLRCFYSPLKVSFLSPFDDSAVSCIFLSVCAGPVCIFDWCLGWRGPFLSGASSKNAAEHVHSGWAGGSLPSGLLSAVLRTSCPVLRLLPSKPSCPALSILCSPLPRGLGV